MNDAAFLTVSTVVAVPLAIGSWRAFRCNLAKFRAARAAAPLEGLDLSGASVEPSRAPRGWPPIDDVRDPGVAAAYAAHADGQAVSFTLVGEIMMVIGGAAIGTTLSELRDPVGWAGWVFAALTLTVLGIYVRTLAVRRWEPVAAGYRERYATLTAVALPPPRRRGLIGSFFGR